MKKITSILKSKAFIFNVTMVVFSLFYLYYSMMEMIYSKLIAFCSNILHVSVGSVMNFTWDLMIVFHDKHMISIFHMILLYVLLYGMYIFWVKWSNLKLKKNFFIEILWILFPILILISIMIPSITFLYSTESGFPIKMSDTFKTMGNQWFWVFHYMNNEMEEYMSKSEDIHMNLSSDNELIIPTNVFLKSLITSKDVIHSFAIPGMSLKSDAIPGRLNMIELFSDEKNILFYGQCSELCGVNHSFMPTVIFTK